ncbi:class I glutamine amidotransferase-like protein [Xylariaceae sp. FL0255]|nr:class I glutamine amidotransferase-like protein [Xylariaceae sp. FL0255]
MASVFQGVNNFSKATDSRHVIHIGVFIPNDCQLLDAAGVDIFGSMSYEYLSGLSNIFPQAMIDSAPSVVIHYIGSVSRGEHIPMTSNQTVMATDRFSDPEVAPGKLNIVYIPGPDPNCNFDPAALEWLREQDAAEGVDILSVCSGIFICGKAGLLKGRDICGPRGGAQEMIKALGYEPRSMRGDELRWIQDGNFWSSGGVTNGNDLVAAYCRANPKYFPRPLVEMTCEVLEVGDRPQHYTNEIKMGKYLEELVQSQKVVSLGVE